MISADVKHAQELIAARLDELGPGARARIAKKLKLHRSQISNILSASARPQPETLEQVAREVGLEIRVVVLPKN